MRKEKGALCCCKVGVHVCLCPVLSNARTFCLLGLAGAGAGAAEVQVVVWLGYYLELGLVGLGLSCGVVWCVCERTATQRNERGENGPPENSGVRVKWVDGWVG